MNPGQFPDRQFPDGPFPDRTIPRPTIPRPDNSPTGQFPERTFPRPDNSPTFSMIFNLNNRSLDFWLFYWLAYVREAWLRGTFNAWFYDVFRNIHSHKLLKSIRGLNKIKPLSAIDFLNKYRQTECRIWGLAILVNVCLFKSRYSASSTLRVASIELAESGKRSISRVKL